MSYVIYFANSLTIYNSNCQPDCNGPHLLKIFIVCKDTQQELHVSADECFFLSLLLLSLSSFHYTSDGKFHNLFFRKEYLWYDYNNDDDNYNNNNTNNKNNNNIVVIISSMILLLLPR